MRKVLLLDQQTGQSECGTFQGMFILKQQHFDIAPQAIVAMCRMRLILWYRDISMVCFLFFLVLFCLVEMIFDIGSFVVACTIPSLGGIRFWDARSGDRVLDIPSLHEGGVTSVHWKPGNSNAILTNGKDSTLKVIDTRSSKIMHTFRDPGFRTLTNHASCSFSPNGAYAAAGSGDSGEVFVWNVKNGEKEKQLSSHSCGAVGVAWGLGGTNGQQVATIDKSGVLILWA